MDEKDKMIQDLRREIDELKGNGKALAFDEKFQRIKEFLDWMSVNFTQDEMEMVENKAVVCMVLDGNNISAFVSGNGGDLYQMVTVLLNDLASKLGGDDGRPLS